MTWSIRIHTTLQHACFIQAPFGAYTSMVVHLFLCSIEFFSREPTLGVSGNSDGCRWLSDPTSRVQIGEQQPQVETLRDCGVSTSHNLNRDTLKPLMFFFDFVRAPNGRGKKSKSKTARISRCFSANRILTFGATSGSTSSSQSQSIKNSQGKSIDVWSCGDHVAMVLVLMDSDPLCMRLESSRRCPRRQRRYTLPHCLTGLLIPDDFFLFLKLAFTKNIQEPSPTFGHSAFGFSCRGWWGGDFGGWHIAVSPRAGGYRVGGPENLEVTPSVKRCMKEKTLKKTSSPYHSSAMAKTTWSHIHFVGHILGSHTG